MEFRRKRRGGVTAVIAVACFAVALSACSSSSGGSGSNKSTSTASGNSGSGGLSGNPVKVGLIADLTGPTSTLFGSIGDFAGVWEKYTNANGGINGHPVKIVVRDSQSNGATGLQGAQQLVQSDNVVAIVVASSAAEATVEPYLAKTDVPLLGLALNPGIEGVRPNTFAVTTAFENFLAAPTIAAKSAGATTFGTVYCAEAPGCAATLPIYKQGAAAAGLKFGGGVAVSATAPSFTAPCLELMSKGVNYMELDLAPATGVSVAAACLQQGYKGTFGVPTIAFVTKLVASLKGAQLAGPLTAFPWWASNAAAKPFQDAMKQYAPNLDYGTQLSSSIWSTLSSFKNAATKVTGDVTPTSLTAAYKTVTNETLGGLLPEPVSFAAGNGPSIKCFWIYKYTVGDAKPALLHPPGTAGNGQSGDLASTCSS